MFERLVGEIVDRFISPHLQRRGAFPRSQLL